MPNQLSRQIGKALALIECPSIFYRHVAALEETPCIQSLVEIGQECVLGSLPAEKPDHRNGPRLRSRCARPSGRESSQKDDEIAASHLLTRLEATPEEYYNFTVHGKLDRSNR